jgi:hypothetical protein
MMLAEPRQLNLDAGIFFQVRAGLPDRSGSRADRTELQVAATRPDIAVCGK